MLTQNLVGDKGGPIVMLQIRRFAALATRSETTPNGRTDTEVRLNLTKIHATGAQDVRGRTELNRREHDERLTDIQGQRRGYACRGLVSPMQDNHVSSARVSMITTTCRLRA